MKIDQYLSEKLRVMSFYAILMVVVAHAYCVDNVLNNGITMNTIIQEIVKTGIDWIAAPTFFFISGFLFFLNFKGTFNETKLKFRRRLKSLFLPYFYWCTAGFALIFLLQLLPISRNYFSQPFYQMSFSEILWNAFYEPINYPLWFIRQLMIFILLTPLLYPILTKVPFSLLFAILGISLIKVSLVLVWDVNILGFVSLFSFVCGAIAAIKKIRFRYKLKFSLWLPLFVIWLILIIFRISAEMDKYPEVILSIIDRLGLIIGCSVFWLGYDLIPTAIIEKMKDIYSYTFIIYVLHGIPIVIFSRIFFSLVRRTPNTELIAFLILPLLTIIFSVQLGKLINTLAPSFYRLITGGR